jgi:hypothetical protein
MFLSVNFTAILQTIHFYREGRFQKLNDNLLAYCSSKYQADGRTPVFLCLILLNMKAKTFDFCDLVVLNNKALKSFGYTMNSDKCETPKLEIRFFVTDSESTKLE